jgi:hypothetical protein
VSQRVLLVLTKKHLLLLLLPKHRLFHQLLLLLR